MAKVVIYSSTKQRTLRKEDHSYNNVDVRSLLERHRIRDAVIFLNNEKFSDPDYVLKDEDVLFVFKITKH